MKAHPINAAALKQPMPAELTGIQLPDNSIIITSIKVIFGPNPQRTAFVTGIQADQNACWTFDTDMNFDLKQLSACKFCYQADGLLHIVHPTFDIKTTINNIALLTRLLPVWFDRPYTDHLLKKCFDIHSDMGRVFRAYQFIIENTEEIEK